MVCNFQLGVKVLSVVNMLAVVTVLGLYTYQIVNLHKLLHSPEYGKIGFEKYTTQIDDIAALPIVFVAIPAIVSMVQMLISINFYIGANKKNRKKLKLWQVVGFVLLMMFSVNLLFEPFSLLNVFKGGISLTSNSFLLWIVYALRMELKPRKSSPKEKLSLLGNGGTLSVSCVGYKKGKKCFDWSDCRDCLSNARHICSWYLAHNGSYTCTSFSGSNSPYKGDYSYYSKEEDCPDRLLYNVILKKLDGISGTNPNWSWIISICITVAVAILSFYVGTRYGKRNKQLGNRESVPMT